MAKRTKTTSEATIGDSVDWDTLLSSGGDEDELKWCSLVGSGLHSTNPDIWTFNVSNVRALKVSFVNHYSSRMDKLPVYTPAFFKVVYKAAKDYMNTVRNHPDSQLFSNAWLTLEEITEWHNASTYTRRVVKV